MSEEGAQHGDPLGPPYFYLVIKERLVSRQFELLLSYMDDVAVRDAADIVLKDFFLLEPMAKKLDLEMNREKCELVGHSDDMRSLFVSHGINLPATSSA